MKAVIFGATGYFGSNLCEQLALASHEAKAIVRYGADTNLLRSQKIEVEEVDFNSRQQLINSMRGMDVAFNCLANARIHESVAKHRRVDVELSAVVFECADLAGIKRFVQLSTEKVYGSSRSRTGVNESSSLEPSYRFNRIVIEREERLLSLAQDSNMALVILRPCSAIGPRDKLFLPPMIKLHKRGFFVTIGDGLNRFTCIDIRDVARAMLCLAEQEDVGGETFVLKGFELSWLELKETLDGHLGKKAKVLKLPHFLMYLLASILERVVPFSIEMPLTRLAVKTLSSTLILDDRKIQSLGFQTLYTLEDAINAVLKEQR